MTRLPLCRAGGARLPLLDGAVGTELIARGLDLGREPPEAWVRVRPDAVRQVHAAYADSGAQVLQTNTFGASRPRLERYRLGAETAALNVAAVSLARSVAESRPVLASLGPTGIDPFERDAAPRIAAAYEEQIAALTQAGVDGLHFETMYHPVEAVAGVEAARRVAPRLPVVVSSTFALGDQGYQTPLGIELERMLRAVEEAAPDALGLNCSLEARRMVGLVGKARALTELPLWVQPQGAASPAECRGPRADRDEVADFASAGLALRDAGADALGGCCGAGPAHIRALAAALEGTILERGTTDVRASLARAPH